MIEIRFHGRGGQGAVTASRVLAIAAFLEGHHSQSIPMYGTERRGAPVTAFVRIGEKSRMVRSLVHEPDYVVVLDPLLRNTVNITEGLKPNGMIIINSSSPPEEMEFTSEYKVATVDATKVALETIGRPITNTAILGAFAKATGEIKLESLLKAVKTEMSGRASIAGFVLADGGGSGSASGGASCRISRSIFRAFSRNCSTWASI